MSKGFHYSRRVQFSETDLAGIAHFSAYFRFMEEAEHALWRAAGLSIGAAEKTGGWPRVAAAFDYKSPLRFEDEFDVHLQIAEKTRKTIRYQAVLRKEGETMAVGSLTIICVRKAPGEALKAADISVPFAGGNAVVAWRSRPGTQDQTGI